MAKKILVKNGVRRPFEERAAKIAVEHLGWVEEVPPVRPHELLKKTLPPEINKPVKLIVPPVEEVAAPVVEKEVQEQVQEKPKKTRKPRAKK